MGMNNREEYNWLVDAIDSCQDRTDAEELAAMIIARHDRQVYEWQASALAEFIDAQKEQLSAARQGLLP